ncbi:collagen alpha-1(VII) chain-like isoform X2 [Panicum hallii]|uniref:collagen alpha-1(VII) chain-like isoform X2 n=1 Tax=Panicum hallii TaxID=206008 RepID=UPI000DF4CE9E|nr:collagen alpha-1(VII) chain-like isoform X2 [Panicum hallii]
MIVAELVLYFSCTAAPRVLVKSRLFLKQGRRESAACFPGQLLYPGGSGVVYILRAHLVLGLVVGAQLALKKPGSRERGLGQGGGRSRSSLEEEEAAGRHGTATDDAAAAARGDRRKDRGGRPVRHVRRPAAADQEDSDEAEGLLMDHEAALLQMQAAGERHRPRHGRQAVRDGGHRQGARRADAHAGPRPLPAMERVLPHLLRARRQQHHLHRQGRQRRRRHAHRPRLPAHQGRRRRPEGGAVARHLRREAPAPGGRRQDTRPAPVHGRRRGPGRRLGHRRRHRRVQGRPAHLLRAAPRLPGAAVRGRAHRRRLRAACPARRRQDVRAAPVLGGRVRGDQRRPADGVHRRVVREHRRPAGARPAAAIVGDARPAAHPEGRRGRHGADAGVGRPDVDGARPDQARRADGHARRGHGGLLPRHEGALRALPAESRQGPELRAGRRDGHHVHAPPEDGDRRRRRQPGAEHAGPRELPRRHRPVRREVRHAGAPAVPHAGHHAQQGLPPAQLPRRVHQKGRAQGAVARRPLPRRGPGGVGRARELRAAVAEAGERRQPPGHAGQRVGVARGGRRRRVLERAGVQVHRRRRGGGVPGEPRRGRGARPCKREGPCDRAQHPGRVHPRHPPRAGLHLHREPVLSGELLRVAAERRRDGGGHQRAAPHPKGAVAQDREQDRGRRAVRRVRGGALVAGGRAGERLRAGHSGLAAPHHGDDVQGHHAGHPSQGTPGRPQGLPHLLLPRQPRGAEPRRVRAAGAPGPRHRLREGAAGQALHDLRPRQDDDSRRRVRHRGVGQHQPALHGRRPRHGDRDGRVPTELPGDQEPPGEGAGPRLPGRAVAGAPGAGRGGGGGRPPPPTVEPGLRAQDEPGGAAVLGHVRERHVPGRPPWAPHGVPGRCGRRGQDHRDDTAIPGHQGEGARRQVQRPPAHPHHMI